MSKRKQRYEVTVNGRVVGSIFRRGDWYHFDYRPAIGIREQVGLHTNDMKQAITNAELHAQGALPLPQAPTGEERRHSKTLSELFPLYKSYYGPDKKRDMKQGETYRRRASTNRRYYDAINQFINFHGENRPAGSVLRQHIETFVEHQRTRPNLRYEGKLSPWTINEDISRVRQFLKWAARSGYRQAAPDFEDLKLPAKKKKARGLRPKEIDTVREKLPTCPNEVLRDQLTDWFELAIQIGLRPGEQSHLLVRDYNVDERLLTVRPSDDAEEDDPEGVDLPFDDHELKNEGSERTMELNDDAHEIIERLLAKAGERKLAAGSDAEQLLFPNPAGNVWHLDTLRHRFKELLPEGMFFTLYSLRHTFAYGCVTADWNPAKLQLFMGHASITTTQGYYKSLSAKQVGAPPSLHRRKVAQG